MRSGFRKKWDNFDLRIESIYRKYNCRKKAKLRLKRMNGGFKCDKEYKEIVVPYWKKYGYKPAKYWYEIFSDREKKVDPRYIPDDLYYGEILPYFSNSQFRRFGEDKCYHDLWFADIKRPETICKNIAGVYYSPEMNPITFDEAVSLTLAFKDECLIKPSIDSGEGRLIKFFTPETMSKEVIVKAFRDMGANFIMQAAVKQHLDLSELNPTSVNTIRIVSFLFEGEVYVLSSILRMGASGAKVDNIGAGGYACPIHEDGTLHEKGVNRQAEWKNENQNGVKFAGRSVPAYQRIVDIIRDKHKQLPHFKLIGWDFAVDEEENPIFIEFNSCPGPNQFTCGPTFGDLTEKVLEEVFIKKTLKDAQN